jgi:polysaccharide export outer membrane protein
MSKRKPHLALLFLYLIGFSACINTKEVIYLDSMGDAEVNLPKDTLEPILQSNDILKITVSSPNPAATEIFEAASSNTKDAGYMINQDGFIEFPLIGNVKAAGLTKKEVKESITQAILARKLLLDPIVSVRYVNFKVTVLGEVAKPSVISVPDEKISLLDALGMAGDMTIYARRDNVMVIRKEGGKRIVKRLDLTSTELLHSPYYYLQSYDIVYVEPNKAKMATANRSRAWIPVIMSSLAVAVIIIDRLID